MARDGGLDQHGRTHPWRRVVPYSLVSAATLGFDLVRLPAGRAVAEVLLVGLSAAAADRTRIADAHPARGLDREQRGVRAVRSRRAREMAASVPHVRNATAGTDGGNRAAVLVAQLEQGTIGDAPTPARPLRDDVLGAEPPADGRAAPDPPPRATAAPRTRPPACWTPTCSPRPPTCWPTPPSDSGRRASCRRWCGGSSPLPSTA